MNIGLKRISEHAVLPTKSTPGSAGYDLSTAEFFTISPGETKVISTGWNISVPDGCEVQVRSRSGLSIKGIVVANSPGTIDSDYTGELKVILHNQGRDTEAFRIGARIAQMVPATLPSHVSLDDTGSFYDARVAEVARTSNRGTNGFGSTGV